MGELEVNDLIIFGLLSCGLLIAEFALIWFIFGG